MSADMLLSCLSPMLYNQPSKATPPRTWFDCLSVSLRRKLRRVFWSSCHVFYLHGLRTYSVYGPALHDAGSQRDGWLDARLLALLPVRLPCVPGRFLPCLVPVPLRSCLLHLHTHDKTHTSRTTTPEANSRGWLHKCATGQWGGSLRRPWGETQRKLDRSTISRLGWTRYKLCDSTANSDGTQGVGVDAAAEGRSRIRDAIIIVCLPPCHLGRGVPHFRAAIKEFDGRIRIEIRRGQ